MSNLSRRTILRLGAGAAAGAAGAFAVGTVLESATRLVGPDVSMTGVGAPLLPPAPLEPPPVGAAAPTMVTGSFVSAARGGIQTNWAIARPPGQTAPLRPVIALHGRWSDAATVMAGGVEQGLAQAVNAGLPPFAVVSVDGGEAYWHDRASGDHAGSMVLDELIPMLADKGLDTSRVAFLGWSMGGYGALLLGARLGPARTAAITAVSPALWLSSGRPRPGPSTGPAILPPTVCSGCRHWRRSRSASTAAPAIRSTRPPSSSSRSCRIRPPVASPPAATTPASGVHSCPPNSPGWHRF